MAEFLRDYEERTGGEEEVVATAVAEQNSVETATSHRNRISYSSVGCKCKEHASEESSSEAKPATAAAWTKNRSE